MRQPLFVDTGFVLALELARDENHARAQAQWQAWSRHPSKLVTTTYVFNEIVTYFNSRSLHAKALQVGQLLLTSPSVELVSVDEDLFFAIGNTSADIKTNAIP